MLDVDKVFVLHVKRGCEERARWMELMLGRMGIDFEYMLDGDICDLSDERMARYFDPNSRLRNRGAIASCAMKHILVMERIVEEGLQRVLILEDDAILRKDFVELFNRSIDDVGRRHIDDTPFFIFYEATHLWYIPRSQRRRGQMLYKPRGIQCAACYCVNDRFAKLFVDRLAQEPLDRPVDEYYGKIIRDNDSIAFCQSHPDLCEQGSHGGDTISILHNKTSFKRFGSLRYRIVRFYKKYILYNLI